MGVVSSRFFRVREGCRVLKDVEAATIAAAASLKFSAVQSDKINTATYKHWCVLFWQLCSHAILVVLAQLFVSRYVHVLAAQLIEHNTNQVKGLIVSCNKHCPVRLVG